MEFLKIDFKFVSVLGEEGRKEWVEGERKKGIEILNFFFIFFGGWILCILVGWFGVCYFLVLVC